MGIVCHCDCDSFRQVVKDSCSVSMNLRCIRLTLINYYFSPCTCNCVQERQSIIKYWLDNLRAKQGEVLHNIHFLEGQPISMQLFIMSDLLHAVPCHFDFFSFSSLKSISQALPLKCHWGFVCVLHCTCSVYLFSHCSAKKKQRTDSLKLTVTQGHMFELTFLTSLMVD